MTGNEIEADSSNETDEKSDDEKSIIKIMMTKVKMKTTIIVTMKIVSKVKAIATRALYNDEGLLGRADYDDRASCIGSVSGDRGAMGGTAALISDPCNYFCSPFDLNTPSNLSVASLQGYSGEYSRSSVTTYHFLRPFSPISSTPEERGVLSTSVSNNCLSLVESSNIGRGHGNHLIEVLPRVFYGTSLFSYILIQ